MIVLNRKLKAWILLIGFVDLISLYSDVKEELAKVSPEGASIASRSRSVIRSPVAQFRIANTQEELDVVQGFVSDICNKLNNVIQNTDPTKMASIVDRCNFMQQEILPILRNSYVSVVEVVGDESGEDVLKGQTFYEDWKRRLRLALRGLHSFLHNMNNWRRSSFVDPFEMVRDDINAAIVTLEDGSRRYIYFRICDGLSDLLQREI